MKQDIIRINIEILKINNYNKKIFFNQKGNKLLKFKLMKKRKLILFLQ